MIDGFRFAVAWRPIQAQKQNPCLLDVGAGLLKSHSGFAPTRAGNRVAVELAVAQVKGHQIGGIVLRFQGP